jgi:septal ring factor EnvC (AmiA/AmiB activator)
VSRASKLVLAALVSLAFATPRASADDEPSAETPETPQRALDGHPLDAREVIGGQLAEQAATIDTTIAIIAGKLARADDVRSKRLRAAYRLLRAPLRSTASASDRMAVARRRAAARLLVDRDAGERGLLADEAARLHDAQVRTSEATAKIATITLPDDLARPANGTVARKFGTLEHDRSKATLSRRGIDLEVDEGAVVSAPADGTVRYAGPIRGLDDGLIVDHGDYFTVIAKLGELTVPVGAPVHRGDRIGRAARHRVYLEVRVRVGPGGLPIDPEPLFEKSRGE